MKILLDTHIALWSVLQSDKLSEKEKNLLLDEENEIYYSVISIWEVEIKHGINPKNMEVSAEEFRELCTAAGFIEVPLEAQHIFQIDSLKPKDGYPMHKDPFDRVLLAQSISEDLYFMTHDDKIRTFQTDKII